MWGTIFDLTEYFEDVDSAFGFPLILVDVGQDLGIKKKRF